MNKNVKTQYTKNTADSNNNDAEKNLKNNSVKEIRPEESVHEKSEPVIGVVTNCKKLNVRNAPNTDAAVVKIVDSGTKFKIKDEVDGFYKVDAGYVMKDYISLK